MPQGSLISFEGITCSGKSTLVDRFIEYLKIKGINSIIKEDLKFYHGEGIGQEIRSLLEKNKQDEYFRFGHPTVETLLILTKRAFESQTRLNPAISSGIMILADRDIDTVCAYQLGSLLNHNSKLDLVKTVETIRAVNNLSTPNPSLTFYLEVSVDKSRERALERAKMAGDNSFKYDKKDIEFNSSALEYFEKVLALDIPGREIVKINTDSVSEDEKFDLAKSKFEEWLKKRRFLAVGK